MKPIILILVFSWISCINQNISSQSTLTKDSGVETWELEMAKHGYMESSSSILPPSGYDDKIWRVGKGNVKILYKRGSREIESISYFILAKGSKSIDRELFQVELESFHLTEGISKIRHLNNSQKIIKQLSYKCSVNMQDVDFEHILAFIKNKIYTKYNQKINYITLFDISRQKINIASLSNTEITLSELLKIICDKNDIEYKIGANAIVFTLKGKIPRIIKKSNEDFDSGDIDSIFDRK